MGARPGTVVDEITAAAQNTPSRELVELAINRVVRLILHADDSSGMIGDLAPQPLDAHEQICDAGLTALRRSVDDRPARPDPGFAVRYTQERMAVLDGDIDKIVALLGGVLTAPHRFIRVAESTLRTADRTSHVRCHLSVHQTQTVDRG